jgi:hypothetical protein
LNLRPDPLGTRTFDETFHRRIEDIPDDDNDVYLEYDSGKGFHINYSVYISYVKHINSSNKA